MSNPETPLILASSSPYRRELLARFRLPFECISPNVDEQRRPNEGAKALALRLAESKAQCIAQKRPDAIVIGSDQVLCCNDEILGKPGNHERAVQQLQKLSGQRMTFYTALYVIGGERRESACITTRVQFRELSLNAIETYLRLEPAYDCAGSCKAEGLGISLCASIESEDPTALIGLPLISLQPMLASAGLTVPYSQ